MNKKFGKVSKLKEQKSNYHSFFEAIIDAILIVDKKTGLILDFNKAALKIYGYSRKELLRKSIIELSAEPEKTLRNIKKKSTYVNLRYHKKKSGKIFPIEAMSNSFIFQKREVVVITIRDISKRIEAMDNLKRSEEFNATLFDHNPMKTIVVDREGRIIKFNLNNTGSGERLPRIGEIMYKDYANKHKVDMHGELMKCMRLGVMKKFSEVQYKDKFLLIKIAPFPEGAIIISMDITKQKKAEKKVKKDIEEIEMAKKEWEYTVDALPQIICLVNRKNRIIRANKEVEKWGLGEVSQIRGMGLHDLFHSGCKEENCNLRNFFKESIKKIKKGNVVENEFYDKILGKYISIKINPVNLKTKRGKSDKLNDIFAVVVVYDSTNKKKLTDKVVDSYKYLGVINRKVSILLNMSKESDIGQKEKILDFVTKSAINLSQADVCLIYKYQKSEKKFHLISDYGVLKKENKEKIKLIPENSIPLLRNFLINRTRIQGTKKEYDFRRYDLDRRIRYFLILPILDRNELKGGIYIGFFKKNSINTQELYFYDVFAVHTSLILKEAGII